MTVVEYVKKKATSISQDFYKIKLVNPKPAERKRKLLT